MSDRQQRTISITYFALELVLYAGFVALYYFLVLHFLGGWLERIFHVNRTGYAVVALLLMVGQGILLEMLTGALLQTLQRKRR